MARIALKDTFLALRNRLRIASIRYFGARLTEPIRFKPTAMWTSKRAFFGIRHS